MLSENDTRVPNSRDVDRPVCKVARIQQGGAESLPSNMFAHSQFKNEQTQ
jgi:hypothetical protein